MIDRADRQLETWVQSLLPGVPVSFEVPRREPSGRGVSLYLLELRNSHPVRGGRRPIVEFAACYLVTVWAEVPEEEHRLLAELVLAAFQSADFEVSLDPQPPDLWLALQTPPRPAFGLRVPVRLELERERGARVREPVRVRTSWLETRHGRLLGPGDVPVAGAWLEFPQLTRRVATDSEGCFRLSGVPQESPPTEVRVRARGREFLLPLENWERLESR